MNKFYQLRAFDQIADDAAAAATTTGSTATTQTQAVDANAGGDPKFTQADLDRVAGATRKEARAATMSELLKELGIEKVDDLKSLVKTTREKQDADKSELQKAQDAIKKLEGERDTAKQQADAALIRVAFESAARDANWLHPELAIRFPYDPAAITIGKDGEVAGVDEVLKALTKKYPDQVKRADDSQADIDAKKRSDRTQPDPKARNEELSKRFRLPNKS